jgi:hypothetical protein
MWSSFPRKTVLAQRRKGAKKTFMTRQRFAPLRLREKSSFGLFSSRE